jgi:hypothetical protein
MGVQTIRPSLRKAPGRNASAADVNCRARAAIRAAGFQKLNVDLMYGFARQPPRRWEETLQHVTLEQVEALARLAAGQLSAAGYLATPGKNTYCRASSAWCCAACMEIRTRGSCQWTCSRAAAVAAIPSTTTGAWKCPCGISIGATARPSTSSAMEPSADRICWPGLTTGRSRAHAAFPASDLIRYSSPR